MKKIIKIVSFSAAIFAAGFVFTNNMIGKVDNESLVKKYSINEKKKIASIAYAESKDDTYGLKVTNAIRPLKTPTYDGSNQAVHPKVLYFKNGWNGYKYWMGITPYPYGNDDYENPQILVSNDGINFKSPKGPNKPLFVPNDVKRGGHYSDIHLCAVNDTLEVYFRYNPAKTEKNEVDNYKNYIYVTKSKDGIHWTDKQLVLDYKTFKTPCAYLSPIINYDNGKYSVWFTNYDGNLYYTETYDWKSFKELKKCNFPGVPQKLKIWHQDLIKTDLGYEFVCCAYGEIFLNQSIYYSLSTDGINFKPLKKIMEPTHKIGTFDEKTLYRPSLVKRDGEYLLYYSAMDSKLKWHVGLSKDSKGIKIRDLEYERYIDPEIKIENNIEKNKNHIKNNKNDINNKGIRHDRDIKNNNRNNNIINNKSVEQINNKNTKQVPKKSNNKITKPVDNKNINNNNAINNNPNKNNNNNKNEGNKDNVNREPNNKGNVPNNVGENVVHDK
ncbi:hypothetical protein [Clostridium botulinum]|uniref:hypothetical protein n=1 Tax=Clostridium botulinum TaxID=1491 RepID=UPI0004DA590F|nr:hypothetical protein [Clostridium botulinum]KEI00946.1 hypothetical protein Z952_13280 [Clostridium botulinum C/D str. BKT75002]KEI11112.1 hypothetical protein Z954_09140 [Clostridium botulinum C/D str. BKT2873]MCD3350274.1 hypothetical protein [Clostridium botulinum D/C]MCD3359294.1 hypothetical protein [Clostridium botulinum D/C]MCD3365057.1 hypothetical protein [Clostridium botulinum D/C]